MQNQWVFSTQGSWDTTTLFNNGEEIFASRLFLQFRQARNWLGSDKGGEMEAIIRSDDSGEEVGIFPGSIEIQVPNHSVLIQNRDPHFAFEETKIWYQEIEVTPTVAEFSIEVDSDQNVVQAYISLFQGKGLGSTESETFTIL